MYGERDFIKEECGVLSIDAGSDNFRLLQLTDIHFGFGPLSRRQDRKAADAVRSLVDRTEPDMIILTGDSIFPFLPKAGTCNNLRQARLLREFFDSFRIPYAFMFGNHDIEMGARASKDQVANELEKGEYCVFDKGPDNITGLGNYIVKLMNPDGCLRTALAVLDSNMYRDGWFYSGFDCIREDQSSWCMNILDRLKWERADLRALAFYHMPLPEFKEAYEKMKLGDKSVVYNFGNIGEPEDYFGISKYRPDFFEKALSSGTVKAMFCGHDHYNTVSLTYKGIMMTYGMSIDYLGYRGIGKRNIQRGGTVIDIDKDGGFSVYPEPLTRVVTGFVRGMKEREA